MSYRVRETEHFLASLEEAAAWLYAHNLEQSEAFADSKFAELEKEINDLKAHLEEKPHLGQRDEITGMRRFPVYDGRYRVTWIVNHPAKTVTLLEFIDSKYPRELREFRFDE